MRMGISSVTRVAWLVCAVFVLLWVGAESAQAQDRRMALLVVNQRGWKQDPFLQYAVKGDLRPMARELRRLGFRVVTLVNQRPDVLRQTFRSLLKGGAPRASTFLFYYSGHADRTHLHMGKERRNAFSYKEFLSFFQRFSSARRLAIFDACFSGEVIRLFGSLTRYRKLLQEGRLKGLRRRSSIDIRRLRFPNQGQERGMRIITSSLRMSWELNRYRASVFTYHLLRGIRGAADLDQDGKISVDELFDFTSRRVKQVTGQKPQQLVVARRSRPYALAPAYRSRLRIGAQVTGDLQVSVANFVWSHRKSRKRPLVLSLVHGKGWVRLRQKRRCWKQSVMLPKGGELHLGGKWKAAVCQRRAALRQKGMLSLPARLAPLASLDTLRAWGVQAGMASQGVGSLQRFQPVVSMDVLWRWLYLGAGVSHGLAGSQSFSLTRAFAQIGAGLPLLWSFPAGQLHLFAGGFVRGGLVLQHFANAGALNLHGVVGGMLQVSWWFPHWSIRLGVASGADFLPTSEGVTPSLFVQVTSGVMWSF